MQFNSYEIVNYYENQNALELHQALNAFQHENNRKEKNFERFIVTTSFFRSSLSTGFVALRKGMSADHVAF